MNEKRYIQELISQGEHSQQDFKYKVMDAHKLAKSVSAFANTDGGRLLIGVRDDGHISGVRSEEEIYMMHAAAFEFCKPAVSIKFDTYHVEGKTLVVATIPPSEKRPIFAIDEEGRTRTSWPHLCTLLSGVSNSRRKARSWLSTRTRSS